MRISSRPSTSTLVATKRCSATDHPPAGVLHGAQDLGIGAAAAQVSAQRHADLRFTRGGIVLEQRGCREDLARRAEPALNGVVRDERLLHGMRSVGTKSFDRGHRRALACGGERQARVDRASPLALRCHEYRAGATLSAAAGELGARETEA